MARQGGIVAAAIDTVRAWSARAQDPEAAAIAAEVYASVVSARPDAGGAPLWAVGPFVFVAQRAAPIIVKAHRLDPADEELVAAYVVAVLADVYMGVVGSFDRLHFERWRADTTGEAPRDVEASAGGDSVPDA